MIIDKSLCALGAVLKIPPEALDNDDGLAARCGCVDVDGTTGVGDCGLVRLGAGDRASGLVACRNGDFAGRVGD